jgi:hypothetical protein
VTQSLETPNSALLTDAFHSALRASPGAAKRERSVTHRRHCHFDCRERAVNSGKPREAITGGILRTEAIIQP